ncbi:Permeases of the major facilitator superfamily [Collimonas arenae]|uniref:Permeases of the major facilitator superfamily n=1 Tax=Collimonas arenae TaxID=279058 RepID=A0A0A1F870_9BURK|nr:MFS transporter [Collimonas arenae]AIY40918.1 Permeases of the major facilitator superfamily [Collimonas arenae]
MTNSTPELTAQYAAQRPSQPFLVLAAVCLAALAMPLSFTGPAVAMPAIAKALGGSPIALNWITNAFMLAFGSCLMAAGALADTYGRKRLFIGGIAGVALSSLALALAPDIVWLDVLRALQGVAGAAAFSGGMATLAQEFDGHARTRAFSLLGTTFGVGLAFGPVLAGTMIDSLGWRSIFLGVAAIAALALVAGLRCVRESRDPGASGLDWPGAISFTAALTLFTYGVLRIPETGWSSRLTLLLLGAALLLLVAFVMIENRVRRPMLDLSLFRYPRFVGVQFLAAAPAYSYVVLQVLLPIRFIGIEGYSAMQAGQMMVALSASMLIVPFIAGMLTRWISAGVISGAGLLICAAGLAWLAQFGPGQPAALLLLPMLTIGFGISLPWGLMDGLAISVVPKERAGMAAGIFSTTRVAGEGVALAIVAAILAALVHTRLRGLTPNPAAAPQMAEAAQRLAMGDMPHALQLLPHASRALLMQSYGDAFHLLLYILAAITVLSAAVVFGFLGSHHAPALRQSQVVVNAEETEVA